MVTHLIGEYLVQKEIITKEQLVSILEEQQKVRIKLGLIAVSEGYMKKEEADEVNRLQAILDKRFGDIAIEKGYLKEGQVENLLKKQGNAYLSFAQVLENKSIMTLSELDAYVTQFGKENDFGKTAIDDLKNDDINSILPYYIPLDADKYLRFLGTAVRTFMRCVDSNVFLHKAFWTDELQIDNAAIQEVQGVENYACILAGQKDALRESASIFAKEEFEQVDEDALDAIGELLNCINGLYASELSKNDINMELMPPLYNAHLNKIKAEKMLVLPLITNENTIYLMINSNGTARME